MSREQIERAAAEARMFVAEAIRDLLAEMTDLDYGSRNRIAWAAVDKVEPLIRADEAARVLGPVLALLDSWPTGDNGQDYRRGVNQARDAIRAVIAAEVGTPEEAGT